MSERKRRSEYTGSCAQLPLTVRICNNSTPVENENILAVARETREDFYRDTFKVIADLSAGKK